MRDEFTTPESPPSHLNRKLTLKPLCSPWLDFVYTQLWNMVAICGQCTGLRKHWGESEGARREEKETLKMS